MQVCCTVPYRPKWPKIGHFGALRDFEVVYRLKKLTKISKNIKNVFSKLELTLEYIMDPWKALVWSILEKIQKKYENAQFWGG